MFLNQLGKSVLAKSGLCRLARRIHRDRTIILAYHNIVPPGEQPVGDRSLHLQVADFRRQLEMLTATHEVVSLKSALESPPCKSRPQAVLTFDDAYSGALDAGVEVLEELRTPATFFVSPDLLDNEPFWWDLLGAAQGGSIPDEIRNYALADLGGQQSEILAWARRDGLVNGASLPQHALSARVCRLHKIATRPLFTLASHSWSHGNLPVLCDDARETELICPLSWFESQQLAFEPWLAYPYGLWSASTAVQARRHYEVTLVLGGHFANLPSAGKSDSRRILPRVNVPAGITEAGFKLLVSGVTI